MPQKEMVQLAHLLRRAGFGASWDELEQYALKGYEATVEELLYPENAPSPLEDEDIIRRYHITHNNFYPVESSRTYWLRRMINTPRPLEEKLALFWHGVFATGYTKLFQGRAVLEQLEMFRRHGLGSFPNLLLELSKNPAMIFWLDNNLNHNGAVNENYGRELLELFSMGVGNYTEDDVKQASRAFTGWTVRDNPYHAVKAESNSPWPYGDLAPEFQYKADDHDNGDKTFLGETGNFDGADIIDIICRQPATARFISRHMYTFFVADEPQVPAWKETPPRDPEAIEILSDAYFSHQYDIRSMLRVLFNSDFFKNAAFAKVKSPTELVVGAARVAGGYRFPHMDDVKFGPATADMGQELLEPPSVEGWHTGQEWLNTSSVVNRVNFAVKEFSDVTRPGIRSIIGRVREQQAYQSPERLIDACLDLLGPLTVSQDTRQELVVRMTAAQEAEPSRKADEDMAEERTTTALQLIAAMPEYQLV